jgi:hypothetical protein
MTDKEAGFPRRIPFIRNPYDPTVVLILSIDWLPLVESTHVMVIILLIFSFLTLFLLGTESLIFELVMSAFLWAKQIRLFLGNSWFKLTGVTTVQTHGPTSDPYCLV